ncbi:MAG: 2,3-bisphosphoglycerate-independent phosphoglycerate mutase, partial [Solirubrobacterales bacterium]
FNGGREREWEGEQREMVDSPRDVPTYDHKPEMSAEAACEAFCGAWEGGDYRFGIINFANPDMVGHTGDVEAATAAVERVDAELRRVVETVHASGGACLICADHGNAEYMREPDGSPHTAHTTNPVPLVVTARGVELREGGILADVAPTALRLLGVTQPEGMSGRSVVVG